MIVNGRVVTSVTQRVNKLFSRGAGAGAPAGLAGVGAASIWIAGRERQSEQTGKKRAGGRGVDIRLHVGTSAGRQTGYGYDSNAVAETRLTVPLDESVNVNLQNMLASDSS